MKKKIFKIIIAVIVIGLALIAILAIRHKIYNNIEEDWELKIVPIYAKSPSNVVYLYKDSYIITNSFITNNWENIVHKRGKLTTKVNDELIAKIKEESNQEAKDGFYFYTVTLKNGEKLRLPPNTEVISEILEMINYDGTIWYATIYD